MKTSCTHHKEAVCFSLQVKNAMDAISECNRTGEGNLLDLAIKVKSKEDNQSLVFSFAIALSPSCIILII